MPEGVIRLDIIGLEKEQPKKKKLSKSKSKKSLKSLKNGGRNKSSS